MDIRKPTLADLPVDMLDEFSMKYSGAKSANETFQIRMKIRVDEAKTALDDLKTLVEENPAVAALITASDCKELFDIRTVEHRSLEVPPDFEMHIVPSGYLRRILALRIKPADS